MLYDVCYVNSSYDNGKEAGMNGKNEKVTGKTKDDYNKSNVNNEYNWTAYGNDDDKDDKDDKDVEDDEDVEYLNMARVDDKDVLLVVARL